MAKRTEQGEAEFKKIQKAQDGAKAMSEYEASAQAVRDKTARLRALRLAQQAQVAAAAPIAVKKKKPAAKKVATKVATKKATKSA